METITELVGAKLGAVIGAIMAYLGSPLFVFNIISFLMHTVLGAVVGWLVKRFLDKYFKK